MAMAWFFYWYLWGKVFDYADTYRPVPLALDRASNIAIAVCFTSSVLVAARAHPHAFAVRWSNRHKSGLVPST